MQIEFSDEDIWLSKEAVDFRKGVNSLCSLVVEGFERSPAEGLYVFYNKAKNRLKILGWHGNGFILLCKRIEKGRFTIGSFDKALELTKEQLNWLLCGLDWQLLSNWKGVKFSEFF